MNIHGPCKDPAKPKGTKRWYLVYFTPKENPDGTTVLNARGKPCRQRHRPYYETEAAAIADKTRILIEHGTAGSGKFLFDREAASDYEKACAIVGDDIKLVDVARFWRKHHPEVGKKPLHELIALFLDEIKTNLGEGRHWSDLKSRLTRFGAIFGTRYADTITRSEILNYVKRLKNLDDSVAAPRTRRNCKTAICNLFSWLCDNQHVSANTLHNSYRGTGITKQEGRQYFDIQPSTPRPVPIRPEVVARGVVKQQAESRARPVDSNLE